MKVLPDTGKHGTANDKAMADAQPEPPVHTRPATAKAGASQAAEAPVQNTTARLFKIARPGPTRTLFQKPRPPMPTTTQQRLNGADPRRIAALAALPRLRNRTDLQRAAMNLVQRALETHDPDKPNVLTIGEMHDSVGCLALQKEVLKVLKANPELRDELGLHTLYVELPHEAVEKYRNILLDMTRAMEKWPGGPAGFLAHLHLQPQAYRWPARMPELMRTAALLGMRIKVVDEKPDGYYEAQRALLKTWHENGVKPSLAQLDALYALSERNATMSALIRQDIDNGGRGGILVTGKRHLPGMLENLEREGVNTVATDFVFGSEDAHQIAHQFEDYQRQGIGRNTVRLQVYELLNSADRY